jgi:hypothetical protein
VTIDDGAGAGFVANDDLTVSKVTASQACAAAGIEIGWRVLEFQDELLGSDETWASLKLKVKSAPKPWRFTFGPPAANGDIAAPLPEGRPPEQACTRPTSTALPRTIVHTVNKRGDEIGFDCNRSLTVITVSDLEARTSGIVVGMQLVEFKGGHEVWTRDLDRTMTWSKMRREKAIESVAPHPWEFTFVPAGTLVLEPEPEPEPALEFHAPPPVAYCLTIAQLTEKRARHKRVATCMAAGCQVELKMRSRHHCKCCGLYCCTSCCGVRKKLIFKRDEASDSWRSSTLRSVGAQMQSSVASAAAQSLVTIEQSFAKKLPTDWLDPSWQSALPVGEVNQELRKIEASQQDRDRPYMLRIKLNDSTQETGYSRERTFPTAAQARLWLEEVVEGDEEDHSWERVCLACREPIPGLEIPA